MPLCRAAAGLAAALVAMAAIAPSSRAADRKRSPVPPTQEIEILDPNVDPLGNPAVVTEPAPLHPGQARVAIPPAVLVHRFYYTGDRSFQGPMLPGGPMILVASHPKTAERVYLEVQMPPGAPVITYRHDRIEYDFGHRSLFVVFGHHGGASVKFQQGVTVAEKVRDARADARKSVRGLADRTGVAAGRRKVAQATKNAAANTAYGIGNLGRAVTAPVAGALRATPLAAVGRDPSARAARERDRLVDRAEREAARDDATIPTNR